MCACTDGVNQGALRMLMHEERMFSTRRITGWLINCRVNCCFFNHGVWLTKVKDNEVKNDDANYVITVDL